MTKIKICGLIRIEDIKYVNELLPDYAGFVFAKSTRQVTLREAKKLISLLDKNIKTVGVFQDEKIEDIKYYTEYLELDVIQLHGSEDDKYIRKLNNLKVWKAVSIDIKTLCPDESIEYDGVDGILLDSSANGIKGGTGLCFDWDVIRNLNLRKKLILAGGLNPENVQDAIYGVKPYAVDVSSGVEKNGLKDYEKIKNFIEKVRKII